MSLFSKAELASLPEDVTKQMSGTKADTSNAGKMHDAVVQVLNDKVEDIFGYTLSTDDALACFFTVHGRALGRGAAQSALNKLVEADIMTKVGNSRSGNYRLVDPDAAAAEDATDATGVAAE
jgi:hypothetical protein